jgi:hypothetical protein
MAVTAGPMDEEIRKQILTLLDQHRIMTIATLRSDGWPQATTVGYVNEGLALYFLCGLDSQKAANLARDDRVSLTIDHDTPDIMAITGLSMAAHAQAWSIGTRRPRCCVCFRSNIPNRRFLCPCRCRVQTMFASSASRPR